MKLPFSNRARRDEELSEEIRAHMKMDVAERVARGEDPREAEAAARREFGNVGVVTEVTREQWGVLWLERLGQDLRFGLRSLRRAPGYATVAITTLMLGIGINTAMFTVINGIVLRPLPYVRQDRLVLASYREPNNPWMPRPAMSDRNYVLFRERARSYTGIGTFHTGPVTLTGAGEPVRVSSATITPEIIGILGIAPALGSAFAPTDGVRGSAPVALLGHELWRDRFGSDPQIVGKRVMIDGEAHSVVGVMPAGFDFPERVAIWRPMEVRVEEGRSYMNPVVARLRDGVTREQALAELQTMVPQFTTFFEQPRAQFVPEVLPLRKLVVGNTERPLWIFAGAVGFVLLIACANVANLQLMRAASRQQELALRTALGAERPRLLRQLLTESVLIATIGGVLGVLLSMVLVRSLLALAPEGLLPRLGDIHVDGTVLVFTAALCLVTGVLFGLAPSLRATRNQLRDSMAQGARTLSAGHGRLRSMLVVSEIALALVLLAGAGLLIRSFDQLRSVSLGFQPANVVSLTVDLPDNTYRTAEAMQQLHRRVLDGFAALPQVEAAGAVNWRPLGQGLIAGDFQFDDGRKLPQGYVADKIVVSPNYFRTWGIRVREGRDFDAHDDASAPKVVIASASVAQRFWPQGNAVGKRISMADHPGPNDWITIVGVVDDVMQENLRTAPHAALYQPIAQVTGTFFLSHMSYGVRTSAPVASVAPAMRGVVRSVDPELPVQRIASMTDLVASVTDEPRFQARLLTAFSVLALLLAAVGIYGVLAYSVAERTREIGIRVALGAQPQDVSSLVVRRTLALSIPGVVIGLGGALAVTRVLDRLLFGVKPNDPMTLITVSGLLGIVAVAAALIPARRAGRVDPLEALRTE